MCNELRLWAARRTKITSFDPALLTVRTTYPTEPLLTLFDPPIKLAAWRPRARETAYLMH